MQELSIRGIISHPATDTFSRSAARFENQIRGTTAGTQEERSEQLRMAAREFESLFVAYLLKVMRDTIEESGFFEQSTGKSVYTELFDQEVARLMAHRGAFGISDLLITQFDKRGGTSDPIPPELPTMPRDSPGPPGPPVPGAKPDENDAIPFLCPVQAPVTSSFGRRKDPFTGEVRFHKGIDLAAPEGTEVMAALGGRVLFVGREPGYGHTIVVEHERGYQTRYAHLASVEVRAGDALQTHQILGTVGSTGRSTGPHLHFEITRHGEKVNPRSAMAESTQTKLRGAGSIRMSSHLDGGGLDSE